MYNDATMLQYTLSANNKPSSDSVRRQAAQWFWAMRRTAVWHKVIGRRSRLLALGDDERAAQVTARYDLGLQTIALSQVKGSEGRGKDFDANFYPTSNHSKERWIAIASLRLLNRTLPPVELVALGDIYYVRDGHHRISVARFWGQEAIEAQVVRYMVRGHCLGS